jgi:hypothetical protein
VVARSLDQFELDCVPLRRWEGSETMAHPATVDLEPES